MSNFKVKFTLKQHTPIIHFQSDQMGATLRATELKPKFDRFLLENVKDLPFRKNANGEKSLDYKIKIIAHDNIIETIEKINPKNDKEIPDPLFFGNMGDNIVRKKFAQAKELEIEFFSFSSEIKKAIEEKFEAFLANTNFGTRQNKGYGCFYLDNPFDKTLIPYEVYSFNSNNWKQDIKLLYSFLRQGINYPKGRDLPSRFYSKPAIFTYALTKNWIWDKKAIKQHFFPNDLKDQQKKYDLNSPVNANGQNTFLLRDLFGLSSEQSWMNYRASIKKEHEKEQKQEEIERFKSPLTFKIINNTVYFWADKSVEKILDKTFKISARGTPLNLKTPKIFCFDEFFEYVKSIDLSKHIDSKFHKEPEFNSLKRILDSIKASK
ncbi:hypothetical protein [Arcobacter ellisii]|uniref:Uncharacterized protein n=1 Tax=Arcobacter ellisii TaxID=913109 RepID=A0A347UAJ1_9BACT|nr:hypothetical protein [Arcobacter ellisii]AXX95869.1 hypothetical protein AELL_2239 [Arcobacter ellisii]RXI29729.1 hypothetical protein CP962_10190 [Arcobacter ellisii]